ncbi:MAG: hypothetical protein C0626_13515 [Arcobacter sp.]|uniref:hypothetical protein n=1 Tax=uncultured Arcobacter sp. TaxID=165434 RepID=UPI000CB25EF6|nr:hypothetical protein [uncultured Arcobacter sp.]PLY08220.1 MAG: hypothetical protein C0626_13515 [Arcobacter sp.]
MKHLLILISAIVLFTACSKKQYFEPEDTSSFNQDSKSISSSIKSFNRDGATLDNGQFISSRGVSNIKLPEGFEFLNLNEGKVISTNIKDKIFVADKEIVTNTAVVAASMKDDILALVNSDNSIMAYDLRDGKILFKEYLTKSLANDNRIAAPFFMSNLILFPTLDGKILVVSAQNYKVVRNIIVDADNKFNNIIYLTVVNNTLIAASSKKIISVGDGVLNIKEYDLRDIISHGTDIYLATIDGQIIKTDISLNIMNRKKYKFAKFYALAFGSSIYALESQGYIVNISEDFKTDKIYDYSFDEEDKVIVFDDTIYIHDEYIKLK